MEVQYRVCAGLDVHRDTVVACLLRVEGPLAERQQTRTFAATTEGLVALSEWLTAAGCGDVAMEATGVFWKPVFNVLENVARVVVANAAQIKGMPGRKTDVQDAQWIAELFQHGLIRPSFIPERFQRELRDLTRTRTTLIDERSAVVNRVQKVLQDANLKLSSVATDVLGVSGRAMLDAISTGATDPMALADLAKGRLRRKEAALRQALTGKVTSHHQRLLRLHLAHLDFLTTQIGEISAQIAEVLRPFEAEIAHLDTIPGVGRATAEILLAELGTTMGQFPSAAHAASWAGMCPGNHQSAGKRHGGKPRKGSVWLRRALVEAASAGARTNGSDLTAQYRRIRARHGHQHAIFAVAHTIVRLAYHLLTTHEDYQPQERSALDARRRAQLQRHALAQLATLGYDVTLTPKHETPPPAENDAKQSAA
jgi:transposase